MVSPLLIFTIVSLGTSSSRIVLLLVQNIIFESWSQYKELIKTTVVRNANSLSLSLKLANLAEFEED